MHEQREVRGSARRVVMGALAALLLAAATACGGSDGSTDAAPSTSAAAAPQSGGRLVIGVPLREPETMLRLTLESLTTFAEDGSVVPYLAESVEPNETFDRWTITVRPGISFHNGEPFDAEAVKANLDMYSITPIYATDPFAPVVATTVVDDRTVEVELKGPWASFPAALTAEQSRGTGLMIAPESIAAAGSLFLAKPAVAPLYGTGPFIFDQSQMTEERWIGERNPDYWQEGLPYVDLIEVRAISDGLERLDALETGDLDLAIVSEAQRANSSDGDNVFTQEGDTQILAVALNTRRAPLDDPDARAALAAATDVEALARAAGVPTDDLATGPFIASSPWFSDDAPTQSFDLERARTLIEEYEGANGPLSIRLGGQDLGAEFLQVQQQLADQWRDAGIDVEIAVVDPFTQTANLLVTGDFDAVMAQLFGMPDPDLHYFHWHSSALKTDTKGAGYNYVGLDDPELDAALDDARTTEDDGARRDAMAIVQDRLAAIQPYVWLWGVRWSVVSTPNVRGLQDAPLPDGGTRWPMLGTRLNLEGVWLQQ